MKHFFIYLFLIILFGGYIIIDYSSNKQNPKSSEIQDLLGNDVYVEQFPKLKGEKDDTLRIQRAIDTIVKNEKRGVLRLKAGESYTISSKIIIDMSYVTVEGNGAEINANSITKGEAINVIGSKSPPYSQATNHITGLRLVGSGKASKSIGIKFQSVSNGNRPQNAASHLAFYNMDIEGFGTGVYFGSNSYLISFYNTDIHHCGTCIKSPSGAKYGDTNYGENITFNHSTIYSSDLGYDLYNDAGTFFFNNCSFDYNTKMGKSGGSSFIVISSSHIESRHKDHSEPLFHINEYSHLQVTNSKFYLINDGDKKTYINYLFDHSRGYGSSELTVRDSWFRNIRTTTNQLAKGRINIEGSTLQYSNPLISSKSNNLFETNGTFDKNPSMDNTSNIFVEDNGVYKNQLNTSLTSVTKDITRGVNDTSSLKITKIKEGVSKVILYIPSSNKEVFSYNMKYNKGTLSSGSVEIKVGMANINSRVIQSEDTKFVKQLYRTTYNWLETRTINFTSKKIGWKSFMPNKSYKISSQYNYYIIEIDLTNLSSGSYFNIDDILVTEM